MDVETGYYYLQSRYYDPAIRRFISSDSYDLISTLAEAGDINLFAYCSNNPVMYTDPTGEFAISATFGIAALIAIAIGSIVIGGSAQLVSNALAGQTGDELWRGVAGAALGAGVNALALCLAMPTGGASLFIAAGASAIVQTGVDTIETLIRGETVGWSTLLDLGINFTSALSGNYLGAKSIVTNSGWIKPQKFFSVFTKSYGQKILKQTAIGASFSGVVNTARKNHWGEV